LRRFAPFGKFLALVEAVPLEKPSFCVPKAVHSAQKTYRRRKLVRRSQNSVFVALHDRLIGSNKVIDKALKVASAFSRHTPCRSDGGLDPARGVAAER
jgi:hypothetical protein